MEYSDKLIIDLILPTRTELFAANVGVPLSLTLFTAGAGTLIAAVSAGNANVAFNLSKFFQSIKLARFYLLGLVRVKKRKPWGKITDKLTGRPIPLATVQVYSAEFDKLKGAYLTDIEGRFDALISAGKYYLAAFKKGYKPAHSEIISVAPRAPVLNVEMSLVPEIESLTLGYIRKISVLSAFKRIILALNHYVLAAGTALSFAVAIILPSALNYFIFGLYLLLDGLNIYFSRHFQKPFGAVIDASSKNPLPLSVVRIFDDEKNWLLDTKVADAGGKFYFLLAPGKYFLTCEKNGYKPFRSPVFSLAKDGIANLDIKMDKSH